MGRVVADDKTVHGQDAQDQQQDRPRPRNPSSTPMGHLSNNAPGYSFVPDCPFASQHRAAPALCGPARDRLPSPVCNTLADGDPVYHPAVTVWRLRPLGPRRRRRKPWPRADIPSCEPTGQDHSQPEPDALRFTAPGGGPRRTRPGAPRSAGNLAPGVRMHAYPPNARPRGMAKPPSEAAATLADTEASGCSKSRPPERKRRSGASRKAACQRCGRGSLLGTS